MTNNETYQSPTIEVVGTLHELTQNGTLTNADGLLMRNTAFPVSS